MKNLELLEILRTINCLGENEIFSAFQNSPVLDHLQREYKTYREKYGASGNFKFIFTLDSQHIYLLFNHLRKK